MKVIKYAGLAVLLFLWCWLSFMLFTRAGGLTLKNIFIVGASGVIVFVPLYRKYFTPADDNVTSDDDNDRRKRTR